jgi:hypothetical protein
VPFHKTPSQQTILRVIKGDRPRRPHGDAINPSDVIWKMIEGCWSQDHRSRPHMDAVRHTVASGSLASGININHHISSLSIVGDERGLHDDLPAVGNPEPVLRSPVGSGCDAEELGGHEGDADGIPAVCVLEPPEYEPVGATRTERGEREQDEDSGEEGGADQCLPTTACIPEISPTHFNLPTPTPATYDHSQEDRSRAELPVLQRMTQTILKTISRVRGLLCCCRSHERADGRPRYTSNTDYLLILTGGVISTDKHDAQLRREPLTTSMA